MENDGKILPTEWRPVLGALKIRTGYLEVPEKRKSSQVVRVIDISVLDKTKVHLKLLFDSIPPLSLHS